MYEIHSGGCEPISSIATRLSFEPRHVSIVARSSVPITRTTLPFGSDTTPPWSLKHVSGIPSAPPTARSSGQIARFADSLVSAR